MKWKTLGFAALAWGQAPLVSVGVAWTRGVVDPEILIGLRNAAGESVPAQTWALGYWPDGSIK